MTTNCHDQISLHVFTVRNEVAKAMFLHLSVILFTRGGVCLSACLDTTPPGAGTPRQQTTPPEPGTSLDQAYSPPEQIPPRTRHPPDQAPPGTDTPLDQASPREQRRLLLRTVRIPLECILVMFLFIPPPPPPRVNVNEMYLLP